MCLERLTERHKWMNEILPKMLAKLPKLLAKLPKLLAKLPKMLSSVTISIRREPKNARWRYQKYYERVQK
jgi:hypothetical protein